MSAKFEVGGHSVRRGERRTVALPMARLYTDTPLTMPVHVVRGHRDGPVMFVCAAIHGDELNGVEIVRRLLQSRRLSHLRGTLLAVPVVNVFGFVNRSRYLPDRRDLNRSFPGSEKGSLAARMAHLFTEEIVARSDFGVDLHTGAAWRTNLPQVRVSLDDPRALEFARSFGAPLVLHSDLRDGSLRALCAERGVPLLVFEGGEALRLSEMAIRTGLRGVMRTLENAGMLRRTARKSESEPVIARSSHWVRAPGSGMLREGTHLGERVRQGQRMALIADPTGEHEEIVTSNTDGLVIAAQTSPLVNEGDALYHVATPDRPRDAQERMAGLVPDFDGPDDPGQLTAGLPAPPPPSGPSRAGD